MALVNDIFKVVGVPIFLSNIDTPTVKSKMQTYF